ncbi:STE20-related kinase adapter protein beta isoform X2 [Takifugu flavidus]|uniref:STE20-related kinase adapter protein beta isoform X2 n=1 Tax=Takifugu flavidus TaxID=433684 RepID=UPI002544D06F|nr:STE20-related kinase adapter protein beta isoform X2 [Takifugu flavidus]XP_056884560.1 STE20-related kinase adapter protein beta isoform X2 [Takifugu flavidus]XP_056884561.1 STE20-related kinase adapter protein beta isoform X2 [Takifugu flavidus]
MSFLDCSCISHTQVQPLDIEEHYEDTSHQFLSCDSSEYALQGPAGGDDLTGLSVGPTNYQLLQSWVRRLQSGFNATSLKKKTHRYKSLYFTGRGFNNLSQVRMGRHIATGQLVAIKQTNLDDCTEEELLQLMNEVLLSRLFRHPNLLTSRLVFSSCCQLWVLTPLMAYGQPILSLCFSSINLGNLLELNDVRLITSSPPLLSLKGSADSLLRTYFPDGMSESLIAYLLYGVLKALEYLHRMGYVHRGVKASHILLSGEGRVYLSGLHSVYSMMREGKRMRVVFDMPHHSPALLPWLSPELLRQDLHGYGVKSDIYSLGIVACELVSGRVPFQDMPTTQMLLQKLRGAHCCLLDVAPYPLGELGGLKVSRSGVDSGIGESVATGSLSHSATAAPAERPQSPGPKNHSTTLHNLVQLCLQQQPEHRPSASTLLTHAFFKQVKRHTRDTFLSLMYPALPLTSPSDPPISSPPAPSCHSPTSPTAAEVMWDFS